jgi:hypothetical protein
MAAVRHLGLFPWCVDPALTFFGTEDAIREKAVPMWWRVKEWKLEATASVLANSDPPSTETYSDSFVFKITDIPLRLLSTSTFQTETDLVVAGKAGSGLGGLGPAYDWSFDALLGDPEENIVLELSLTIGPNFEFSAFGADTRSVSSNGKFEEIGSITSNFCGVSFSAPLKYNFAYHESLYVITSFESTLTATEYWEYDPNDGRGPIYNSSTGAKIRYDVF